MTEYNEGDLISREALKKTFDEYIKANPKVSGIFELGKIIIDKAPAVEPEITNVDIQNAIKQGYNDGFEMAKAKFERPQGEWKNHNSYYKRCSNCQKIVGFDYILQDGEVFNFCPNCGAKMSLRGKEE